MLKIVNNSQLFLLVISHTALICINLIHFSNEKILLLFSLRRSLYHAMCVAFLVLMRYNMRSIQTLYRICGQIKRSDLRTLFWINFGVMVTRILVAANVEYIRWSSKNLAKLANNWIIALEKLLTLFTEFNAFGIVGFGVFMFFMKGTLFLENDVMVDLLSRMESKKVQPLEVYLKVQRFLDIKECFCQSMSFIPFFMFAFAFIKSAVDILKLKIGENSLAQNYYIIFFVILIIEVTTMALTTSSACNQSRKLLICLEKKIVTSTSDLIPWTQSLNKIIEAKGYEYRVWDLFSINNKVLLTLVSSLVTFTVLFIQIVSRSIE